MSKTARARSGSALVAAALLAPAAVALLLGCPPKADADADDTANVAADTAAAETPTAPPTTPTTPVDPAGTPPPTPPATPPTPVGVPKVDAGMTDAGVTDAGAAPDAGKADAGAAAGNKAMQCMQSCGAALTACMMPSVNSAGVPVVKDPAQCNAKAEACRKACQ